MNDPAISGINTTDTLDLACHVVKLCSIHADRYYSSFKLLSLLCADFCWPRNINELPNEIPRDVIARLKDFRTLCTQEDINSWRVFCETSPYEAVRSKYQGPYLGQSSTLNNVWIDWYKHKCIHPWTLTALSGFLSPMNQESWNLVEPHTNLVETSHAGRNRETRTGMALLAAIEECVPLHWQYFIISITNIFIVHDMLTTRRPNTSNQ
jgi:hypothetical protein